MWGLISVLFMFVCLGCSHMLKNTGKSCYAIGMIGALIVQFIIIGIQIGNLLS